MSGSPDSFDYWLQRLALAVESAADAPGQNSRDAYLDLARHYWSMHVMVHGRCEVEDCEIPRLIDAASLRGQPQMRWAA